MFSWFTFSSYFTVILIAKPASAAVTTLAYVVVVCGYVISIYSADNSPPILVRRIPHTITVTLELDACLGIGLVWCGLGPLPLSLFLDLLS